MLKVGKLRKSLGIWKSEIAQKVNVNQTAVSQWERSTVAPPLNNAKRLADVPGCAIDKLGGALLGWMGLLAAPAETAGGAPSTQAEETAKNS